MPKNRVFFVTFTRIGRIGKGYTRYFEAPTVAGIEPEIQSFVDGALGEGHQVTLEPLAMNGQISYGLDGNFTIVDIADEQ